MRGRVIPHHVFFPFIVRIVRLFFDLWEGPLKSFLDVFVVGFPFLLSCVFCLMELLLSLLSNRLMRRLRSWTIFLLLLSRCSSWSLFSRLLLCNFCIRIFILTCVSLPFFTCLLQFFLFRNLDAHCPCLLNNCWQLQNFLYPRPLFVVFAEKFVN